MEKGYYVIDFTDITLSVNIVAIHNKNGKGLLRNVFKCMKPHAKRVAIHNKNGKGLLRLFVLSLRAFALVAIHNKNGKGLLPVLEEEKSKEKREVAIHNKNGKGLLRVAFVTSFRLSDSRNPQ